MLKYDAGNRSRLVPMEEVEARDQKLLEKKQREEQNKKEEEVPEPTQEGMDPVEDTPVIEIGQETNGNTSGSMEEFYALPQGITITYNGSEICDSYPQEQSDFFALDATSGKRLLVLKFGLENQSQTNQSIDLLSKEVMIRVMVNGDYRRNILTTMLTDDMSTYTGEIPAGGTINVVLLAEVDNAVAENISSLSLNLKSEADSYTMQLQ